MSTALTHCRVFDGSSSELQEDVCIVIEGDRIRALERTAPRSAALVVDCGGRIAMPGLIDAHVHVCAPTFNFRANDHLPPSLLAIHGARALEGMLLQGFTSVRDAGGADRGLWLALERGLIRGPRLFYAGLGLSQTGGHGDMRPADEPCGCGYAGSISRVVDGVDAVRAAAREELRKGAHHLKLFVSGGVTSPTDPIWMDQFTAAEIRAAVEEAATRRAYVMAHCHTDAAARRCIELGVRSIEHGTHIEKDTAGLIARAGAFVVPTLSVVDIIRKHGPSLGLPAASLPKLAGIYERMAASIQTCAEAQVALGLGTDILGTEFRVLQSHELALRGEIQRPLDVLRAATSVNAALLQKTGELGCIAPGALADILVLHGNPLEDLTLFRDAPQNLALIMKGGELIRHTL